MHPRLRRFQQLAKQEAETEHDIAAAEKRRQQAAHPALFPTKAITKRQQSNKRSAEICRAAKFIYIRYLENAIVEEEQSQINITRELFNLTTANYMLQEKVQQLEKRLATAKMEDSWLTTPNPAAASNNDQAQPSTSQFFLDSSLPNDLPHGAGAPTELEWVLDAAMDSPTVPPQDPSGAPVQSSEEIEMSFRQSTSTCTALNNPADTARSSSSSGNGTDSVKTSVEHTSPVTILDSAPHVPSANLLGGSLHFPVRHV